MVYIVNFIKKLTLFVKIDNNLININYIQFDLIHQNCVLHVLIFQINLVINEYYDDIANIA